MKGFLLRVLIVALGLWVASAIVPGVEIDDAGTLLIAALLLGIVNAFVRPVLVILTLPLTILTLGLFLLVINAATAVACRLAAGRHGRDRILARLLRRDRRRDHRLGCLLLHPGQRQGRKGLMNFRASRRSGPRPSG